MPYVPYMCISAISVGVRWAGVVVCCPPSSFLQSPFWYYRIWSLISISRCLSSQAWLTLAASELSWIKKSPKKDCWHQLLPAVLLSSGFGREKCSWNALWHKKKIKMKKSQSWLVVRLGHTLSKWKSRWLNLVKYAVCLYPNSWNYGPRAARMAAYKSNLFVQISLFIFYAQHSEQRFMWSPISCKLW